MKNLIVISLMLGLVSAASADVNLIDNGSFETASIDPGSFATLNPGSTVINNWTVDLGTIDYIGTYWDASDGDRSIDLGGYFENGRMIAQSFPTVVGNEYYLSFDMAGNPDGPPALKTLDVSITGIDDVQFSFDKTGKTKTNMGWETKYLTFTATAATTELKFTSTSGDSAYGPALDNVSVVPVPGAVLLGAMGLGMAGWLKQRTNKADTWEQKGNAPRASSAADGGGRRPELKC